MTVLEFIHRYLPDSIMETSHDVDNRFGLPHPYTVPSPGDIFDCMFYWDTYFTNVGLISDGNIQQAIYNTDNIRHLVDRFGYMPNSSKRHHLGQSQPPFYYRMVEELFAITGDQQWLEQHYDSIAREYAFWMTERIAPNGLNRYRRLDSDLSENELDRRFRYAQTRFQNLVCKSREEQLAAVNTVSALCESGWDCCYRFEFAGPDYNPVDLNSLLYGLECAMEKFSNILNRGEAQLWANRARKRKERMDQFLYCREKDCYLDWNYVQQHHSPIVSVASLFPLFVGLVTDSESMIRILKQQMLLPFGVAGTVKPNHPYQLQWEYPNIWAPLQYIAFIACRNAGKYQLAEDIAKRYLHLIERNFASTGNLWEKYDGFSGMVMNAEYEAPPMLGWTAGIYLVFYYHFNQTV